MPSFRVVGPGRADDPTAAAAGVDLLVLATPDAAIGNLGAVAG